MSDQRAINIIFVENICELYGTDATQFEVGTLAAVTSEGVYFSLVDSGGVPSADLVSTTHGPLQPGCPNPQPIGTSNLRWARTSAVIVTPSRGNAPAYYVNANTGDDTLDGLTPATAVKHIAEVSRRMYGADYNTTAIHIYCLTNIPGDDRPFFVRKVRPGLPIVIHSWLDAPAPYKPAPVASIALANVTVLDPGANQDQEIAAVNIDGHAGQLMFLSALSSHPGSFAWGRFAPAVGHLVTTPFGSLAGPTTPTIALADPIVGDVVEVYVASGFPTGGLQIDIDPGAELWLKGFSLYDDGTATAPQNIVSGNLRLVQCTGDANFPATFDLYGDAALFYDGCSNANIESAIVHGTGRLEAQTTYLTVEGDVGVAKTRFYYNHCAVQGSNTLGCVPNEPAGVESSYTGIEDLAIRGQQTGLGAIYADLGARVSFTGFLYGLSVTSTAITLGHSAEGVYTADLAPASLAPTFVATQQPNNVSPGDATVTFPRSTGPAVTKMLRSTDLPFVSNAMAVDSQGSMLST